jgi:hypothetical protein
VTQYKELIRTTLGAEANGALGVTEAMASSTAVVITTVRALCAGITWRRFGPVWR